jgi:O-antigen/teichoic acid export membrane protein
MTKENIDEISNKVKTGITALYSRSIFVYILRFLSVILISRWLLKEDFGLFAILNGWLWGISLLIPDLALEAALTQKSGDPSKKEWETVFGISLFRGILIVLIFLVSSHYIMDSYDGPSSKHYMLIALSLSTFFSSMVIPQKMFFEKNLKFKKLIKIEILQTIILYIVQISLAWFGYGTWSFVLGFLVSSFIFFILMYKFGEKIHFPRIHIDVIKNLLHFSLPTQLKKVTVSIRVFILPVILGQLFSLPEVGIVSWTLSIANVPGALVDNFDRIMFPSLSKLKNNIEAFKELANRNFRDNFFIFIVIFSLVAYNAAPGIILFFTSKWASSITLLPIGVLVILLQKYRLMFASVMNASGNPKHLLYTELVSTILEVSLAIYLSKLCGIRGYFYAVGISELVSLIIVHFINSKYISSSTYIFNIALVFLALLLWPLMKAIQSITSNNFLSCTLTSLAALLIYFLVFKIKNKIYEIV